MERLKHSLELEDEIDLHEKGWIAQRIGWILLLLILVCSVLGILGTGWLSGKTMSAGDYTISYERFARFQNPMTITIRARGAEGQIDVSMPQEYLEKLEVSKIIPEPSEVTVAKDATIYTFPAQGGATIRFHVEPQEAGRLTTLLLVNGTPFTPSHFIYP